MRQCYYKKSGFSNLDCPCLDVIGVLCVNCDLDQQEAEGIDTEEEEQ